VLALGRVFDELMRRAPVIAGEAVGFAGNLEALARGRRFLDEDLNRAWQPQRIEALRDRDPRTLPVAEEAELVELHDALQDVIADARGPVYFLDLHTTSSPSAPFGLASDTPPNRSYATAFGVPIVLGLGDHIDGVLAEYASGQGWITMDFEGGPHEDPASIDHHESAVWIALGAAGLLAGNGAQQVEFHRRKLAEATRGIPRVMDIVDRHPIARDDEFEMLPGFENFQPVRAGQPVARDRGGDICVARNARLFMPLYQGQGDDGYFLVRPLP
jgi:succinylglutamate desuccinylase